MIRDLARSLRRASPDVRDAAQTQIADRVATTLQAAAAPVECRAITRYVLAARLARQMSIDDAHARTAIDRLASYGEERIAECVEIARGVDPTLAPYVPGEITRAQRGLDVDEVVAPPSLGE